MGIQGIFRIGKKPVPKSPPPVREQTKEEAFYLAAQVGDIKEVKAFLGQLSGYPNEMDEESSQILVDGLSYAAACDQPQAIKEMLRPFNQEQVLAFITAPHTKNLGTAMIVAAELGHIRSLTAMLEPLGLNYMEEAVTRPARIGRHTMTTLASAEKLDAIFHVLRLAREKGADPAAQARLLLIKDGNGDNTFESIRSQRGYMNLWKGHLPDSVKEYLVLDLGFLESNLSWARNPHYSFLRTVQKQTLCDALRRPIQQLGEAQELLGSLCDQFQTAVTQGASVDPGRAFSTLKTIKDLLATTLPETPPKKPHQSLDK